MMHFSEQEEESKPKGNLAKSPPINSRKKGALHFLAISKFSMAQLFSISDVKNFFLNLTSKIVNFSKVIFSSKLPASSLNHLFFILGDHEILIVYLPSFLLEQLYLLEIH